ncbi:MAG: peptidyl-prolyl cis-trans isomerase [Nitrospiraceae bacterium]|nr:peptidyl-prolyl cis-trans isomerase [Nitrospiraceae bacterium]
MNRLKLVLAAMTAAAFLAVLPGTGIATEQKVYAKVNGTDLTQIDYVEAFNQVIPFTFHRLTRDIIAKYKPQIIEKMIDDELCYQEAVRTGLKMPAKLLRGEKEYVIAKTGGSKGFEMWLKGNGITKQQYWALLKRGWLIQALKRKEIGDKSVVTDQEARAYYEAKKKTFFRPGARKLSEICFKVDPAAPESAWQKKKQFAEKILDKIKKGANFGTMAWNYSEDPYRVKEGDRGIVHRGMLEDQDMEKAVFQLKQGQVSGVIKTLYGYNIVKVEQVYPPQQLSFNTVKQGIISSLSADKKKKATDALMSRLKKGAKIEILDGK